MTKSKDLYVRYMASGLSQKLFAKEEGISPSTLNYHVKKSKEDQEPYKADGQFAAIKIRKEVSLSGEPKMIHITTTSGVKISIPL